jgi:DNA primase
MAESVSVFERIKQKLDIVDEIGAVVPLRKSGKAFKGLCPFHSERTPSFYVFPATGTWRCFGCQEHGDLFTFVEKQQGLEFRDALTQLAERAGVPLERAGMDATAPGPESAESAARRRLRAVNEAAAIWFHHQLLQTPEAQYARSYLESRGVNNDSIVTWRLGYAPDGDRLVTYLLAEGYTATELVEAGLARERDATRGGGLYDYFRNRVIFPIRDGRGQTIAFGGRELGGGPVKYLNSPQTALFDKSATLFGLDLARDAIRRADQAIIVEGYMDAVVPHQYGTRNVVACIGSAITDKHVRLLKKLTRRLALALDPDAAGQSATLRGIAVAQEAFDRVAVPVVAASEWHGISRGYVRFEEQVDAEITVVRLPNGEDPDEFVRRDLAGWQRAIADAPALMDFLFEVQMRELDLATPAGKAEAAKRLLPLIAERSDRASQDAYLRKLAARLRVDERELTLDFQRVRRARARDLRPSGAGQAVLKSPHDSTRSQVAEEVGYSAPVTHDAAAGPDRLPARLLARQSLEEFCLAILVDRPLVWREVSPILTDGDFTATGTRELFRAYVAAIANGSLFHTQRFLDDLPPILSATAERARAHLTEVPPEEGAALMKMATNAAYRIKRARLREEMAELDYLQRDAEQSGDGEALRAFLGRKQQLLAERKQIDSAASLYG